MLRETVERKKREIIELQNKVRAAEDRNAILTQQAEAYQQQTAHYKVIAEQHQRDNEEYE